MPAVTRSTTYPDIVHTGLETPAGRYLRSFWQPVARCEDVPAGRALPLHIMNEWFTLYRGESGDVHLVDFRCAHRGTQLNVGWVEGDNIRCRYHGWAYDGAGQCVEQPGEAPDFAARVRIKSYPVEEYLGLVYVYLGTGEPPPMRRISDFDRPGVVRAQPPEVLPCNYFNRLQGGDHHAPWTHRESFRRSGTKSLYVTLTPRAYETKYGIDAEGKGGRRYLPNMSHITIPITGSVPVGNSVIASGGQMVPVQRLVICGRSTTRRRSSSTWTTCHSSARKLSGTWTSGTGSWLGSTPKR